MRWDYDQPMSAEIVPFAEFSSQNFEISDDTIDSLVDGVFRTLYYKKIEKWKIPWASNIGVNYVVQAMDFLNKVHDPHIEQYDLYDYEDECEEPSPINETAETTVKKRKISIKPSESGPKFELQAQELGFQQVSDITYRELLEQSP